MGGNEEGGGAETARGAAWRWARARATAAASIGACWTWVWRFRGRARGRSRDAYSPVGGKVEGGRWARGQSSPVGGHLPHLAAGSFLPYVAGEGQGRPHIYTYPQAPSTTPYIRHIYHVHVNIYMSISTYLPDYAMLASSSSTTRLHIYVSHSPRCLGATPRPHPRRPFPGVSPAGPPGSRPRGHHVTLRFLKRPSQQKFREFAQLGPYFVWENAVHGPSPYKKYPHQQFLAPYSVACLFTTQMRSVSLCRKEISLCMHLCVL